MRTVEEQLVSRALLRKRKLPYGFKAEAKRRSLEVRRGIGAGPHDQVDCFALAESMDIKIVRLSDLPASSHSHHLSVVEPEALSAATVRSHGRTGIWVNRNVSQ